MIRILFVAAMVASSSLALAHEEKECKCPQADVALSFREEVLSNLYPLTREVMGSMLLADEGGNGLQHEYRVEPGIGLRIVIPSMRPTPTKLDFQMPRIEMPPPIENQPLPSHLASS